MKNIVTRIVAAIALLAAQPALAQDRMSLILDWFVNPNHGPLIVAQELGLFAERGLEVEIVAPADPADPPKLVAAGKADLAISYQPSQHLHAAEGLPLLRVGTLIATPLNCLLVLDDGPVRSVADLKGRKIGFSVAGVDEALLKVILGKHGLTLDDVEMVNVNWSMAPSLMSGQVDAVIGAARNFQPNQMQLEGIPGRCFNIEEEGVPPYDEAIYVANSDTLDEKRDMIRRFLQATEAASLYIANHPERSWDIFRGHSAELDDDLNALAWKDTVIRFTKRPEALDVGRYERFERFYAEAGLVEGIRPVSRIAVDPGRR